MKNIKRLLSFIVFLQSANNLPNLMTFMVNERNHQMFYSQKNKKIDFELGNKPEEIPH